MIYAYVQSLKERVNRYFKKDTMIRAHFNFVCLFIKGRQTIEDIYIVGRE